MNLQDQELIYAYLNNSLNEYQSGLFAEKMKEESFSSEFIKFVQDEEMIQRALSEIDPSEASPTKIKSFTSRIIKFAAAAALLFFAYLFYDMNNYVAEMSVYKGKVEILRNGKQVRLEKNTKIREGDIIDTLDGTCTIKYFDKTTIRVENYSEIRMNSHSNGKNIQLVSGSLYSSVTPQDKNSRMTINSSTGSATVLGTKFTVTSTKTAMKLDVIKGAVHLKNNTGHEAVVKSGEYAITRDNVPVEVLKTPVQDEIKEEEEKFYRWLSYSTKLRNDSDLVAYYDFQELDDSPNILKNRALKNIKLPLDGKMTNTVPVQGRWIHKEALYFTGRSFIDCGSHEVFNIQDRLTIFAWVKSLAFKSNQETVISKADSAWRLARYKNSDGIELAGTGLKPNSWTIANEKVDDGKWHLIVGVYNGSSLSVYIDGKLEASEDATGKIALNYASVSIGTNSVYNDRFFNGWIDELGIFKRALNKDEIQKLFRQGKP